MDSFLNTTVLNGIFSFAYDAISVMNMNNKVSTNIIDQQEEKGLDEKNIETLMEHGDNYNSFQDPRGEVSGGKKCFTRVPASKEMLL
jgi:hypothetical protein